MASRSAPAVSSRDTRKYGTLKVKVTDLSTCYICGLHPFSQTEVYCPICKFPQRGLPSEQYQFVVNRRKLRKRVKEAADEIILARRLLLSASGEYFLAIIFDINDAEGENERILRLAISGIFLGMWFYSKTNLKQALTYSIAAVVTIELGVAFIGAEVKAGNIVLLIIALILLIVAYRSVLKSITLLKNIDPVMAMSVQNDIHE
ncbi:MAG: hypothetical protein IM638_16675 [Bacteroidetes bacterium]|nr:hypothetical protein [Bacteroidota bacterium]